MAVADLGTEVEPNNTLAQADSRLRDGLDVSLGGAISAEADVDFYRVVIPPGRGMRAEVVPTNPRTECDVFNAVVTLVDAAGLQVHTNGSILGACPFIDGTNAPPVDVDASNGGATAKTVFVAVSKGPGALVGALPYRLVVTVR
jgi:hypothetical protein